MQNTYLRFLKSVNKLDETHPVGEVDTAARELLNVISICHSEGHALTVTSAMKLNFLASPATIHRKIEELKKRGLVSSVCKDGNNRTKYLVPTDLAYKRYELIEEILTKKMMSKKIVLPD